MAGEVPEKYYIVQNNDVIRIKYLLVYCQKSSTHRYCTKFLNTVYLPLSKRIKYRSINFENVWVLEVSMLKQNICIHVTLY